MQAGSWADWSSVVVNAVLAATALYGIRQANASAKAARRERDQAERALSDERAAAVRQRQASLELEAVMRLADLHGALYESNVYLRPFEVAEVRNRLAAVSEERLTLTRQWFGGGLSLREAIKRSGTASPQSYRRRFAGSTHWPPARSI